MQRKTKSVIACGMAAALMLTTLGMENEVSAKAAPKMQTKVLSLKKGQKKTIRIKGKGILKTTWKTTKKERKKQMLQIRKCRKPQKIRGRQKVHRQ